MHAFFLTETTPYNCDKEWTKWKWFLLFKIGPLSWKTRIYLSLIISLSFSLSLSLSLSLSPWSIFMYLSCVTLYSVWILSMRILKEHSMSQYVCFYSVCLDHTYISWQVQNQCGRGLCKVVNTNRHGLQKESSSGALKRKHLKFLEDLYTDTKSSIKLINGRN